jgi:lipopolysaccharide transport system ATP-binding protein
MSEVVIKVENLSKQYRLGQVGTGTISHDLNRWWAKLQGKEDPSLTVGEVNDRTSKGDSDYVWSLRDINFEIKKGDAVGIIGRNGAGKSTLLKILSKVTGPTTGSIKVKGRVASLLEVGTGFHPELTGKENVFLNGAILGMKRHEIKRKFDEIVAFSGVERYIDTPVKRYSSGMYVRLAFAVAAHLESEILIVDEVLAVGDTEFQKKCLGKMGEVSKGEGRTVLFVSHNMAAVKALCNKGIVLKNGMLLTDTDAAKAISFYMNGSSETSNERTFDETYSNEVFALKVIRISNANNVYDGFLYENDTIILTTEIDMKQEGCFHFTYHLIDEFGEALFSFSPTASGLFLKKGVNIVSCSFPKLFFQSGRYFLSFFLVKDKREAIFVEKDVFSFTVVDGGRDLGTYMGREPGFIRPRFEWNAK